MTRSILSLASCSFVALAGAASGAEFNTSLALDAAEVMRQDAAAAAAQPDADAALVPPQPSSWKEGWEGSVELGLNGTTGNSERVSFRGGVSGRRQTDDYDTRLGFFFLYARDDGDTSDNRVALDARNDWLFKESPWRFFATLRSEYDQFQDWNTRTAVFIGPGYEFIKNDKTLLVGRLGIGGNYRTGGNDDGFTPEALIGADFEHRITERQKIFLTGEIYPNLDDGGEFRGLARGGWEILVDPDVNMTLKIGFENRYDSDPGGDAKKNDFDYYLALVWAF